LIAAKNRGGLAMKRLLLVSLFFVATDASAATCNPSTNDAVIVGTTGTIVDSDCNAWTITTGAQVSLNGTADTTTANVTEMAYVSGAIWQENTAGNWYEKTSATATWVQGTDPLPATPELTASLNWSAPTTYTTGTAIPAGTAITYSVYEGSSATTLGATPVQSGVTATSVSLSSGFVAGQTYCFAVSATANGLSGAQSNVACKTMGGTPSAPTGLTVQ